ncbi:unnamed protein product [Effrenium voratum]|nr:unnamed protein product [Effrenium voratum]|mmetsp:Transcript_4660/g.11149  ORF Transcript_4660/g.11149 Transcript_4660/m.11149 type:complete len:232 (+) Transcript_4660:72-767(+)
MSWFFGGAEEQAVEIAPVVEEEKEPPTMRERIAENPVPFQVLSCVLIVMGLSFVGCGMHRRDPIPELWVERPSEGFCCWRDKPSPFYAGDPCACPREHRGDFPCPPEGCSEEGQGTWQRGAGTSANGKEFCHRFLEVASWCPSDRPQTPAPSAASPQVPAGFCCWRDHPVPGYWGEACDCPDQHRGDYHCPEDGCTDSTGARWKRGPSAPFANVESYCKSLPQIAAWCETR